MLCEGCKVVSTNGYLCGNCNVKLHKKMFPNDYIEWCFRCHNITTKDPCEWCYKIVLTIRPTITVNEFLAANWLCGLSELLEINENSPSLPLHSDQSP